MHYTLISLIIPAIFLISVHAAFAQDTPALQKNDKIRITYNQPKQPLPDNPTQRQRIQFLNTPDINQVIGAYMGKDETGILIHETNKTFTVNYPISSLIKLEKRVPKQKKYTRNLIIGFTIGTAAGALLAVIGNSDNHSFSEEFRNGALIGGIPGMAIGAFTTSFAGYHWIEIPIISLRR